MLLLRNFLIIFGFCFILPSLVSADNGRFNTPSIELQQSVFFDREGKALATINGAPFAGYLLVYSSSATGLFEQASKRSVKASSSSTVLGEGKFDRDGTAVISFDIPDDGNSTYFIGAVQQKREEKI